MVGRFFTENETGSFWIWMIYRSTKLALEMKDTFLDFQNPRVSYSSKKSPMFHSYPGALQGFLPTCLCLEPALAIHFLGHLGHLCDLQIPFFLAKCLHCNQPYTKNPTTLLPPQTKLRSTYTNTILYPITFKKNKRHAKKKKRTKLLPKNRSKTLVTAQSLL